MTPADYLDQLASDRQASVRQLRQMILDHLPKGFTECINYGMLGYVVPHALFPAGYHCDPKLPLPFLGLASQKSHIALYHMGIYASPDLMNWFVAEYPKHSSNKLDMGKSCIRFKKPEDIPFALIGQLLEKMTVNQWVALYKSALKN